MKNLRFFLYLCCLFFTLGKATPTLANNLLPPEKAFAAKVIRSGNYAELELKIADNYYLYKNSIHIFSMPANILKKITLPDGKEKTDEFLGKQLIYTGTIRIPLYLNKAPEKFTLSAQVRGCAEVAKICFSPYTHVLSIRAHGSSENINRSPILKSNSTITNHLFTSPIKQQNNLSLIQINHVTKIKTNSNQNIKLTIKTLLTYYIAGLLLAFTACMYPLIPILSSIITDQKKLTRRRGFLLSLSYTQGLAFTYTLVGIGAATTGTLLTVWLQKPLFIIFSAVLITALSLAMFGIWNIQVPSFIQSKLTSYSNKLPKGNYLSIFIMGTISALIIGPCVAPPLVLALAYIASTGDIIFGSLSLYVMALGLGTPLLLIGYFGGNFLPKAGSWMPLIKNILGLIMLGMAINLLTPIISIPIKLILFALLAGAVGIYLLKTKAKLIYKFNKISGIIFLFVSISLLITAYSSTNNKNSIINNFQQISTIEELQKILNNDKNKPIILDFYADWCVECRKLNKETFGDVEVKQEMQSFILLRADITKNTKAQQKLYKHFGLFGPPAILLMHPSKEKMERIIGFISARKFQNKLKNF